MQLTQSSITIYMYVKMNYHKTINSNYDIHGMFMLVNLCSEMNPNIVFIQYVFMCVIKMSIHSVQDTCFWNNLHQVFSQSKDWKAKII
jgi:hypothetical protein